jgi:hypothetical protein
MFYQNDLRSRFGWTPWLASLSVVLLLGGVSRGEEATSVEGTPTAFQENIVPFLQMYCVQCHAGEDGEADLSFDRFQDSAKVQEEYALWERVLRMLDEREMPPDGEEQPSEVELREVVEAIQAELDAFDCSGERRPGRVTIRRLNRTEYNNTLRDLLGIDFRPADDFPSDDVGHGFDNIADVLSMSPILVEKYLDAAESAIDQALAEEATRNRLLGQLPENPRQRRESARANLEQFATRAFRRPVSDEELDRLVALLPEERRGGRGERGRRNRDSNNPDSNNPDNAAQEESFGRYLRTPFVAILTSPHFLFRIEKDPGEEDPDGIRRLDDYEVATRLSYFLWSTMPDEELFRLAKEEKLGHSDIMEQQVRRMMADPKARALVDNFAGQWLQLRDVERISPDPERFPSFDEPLRLAMLRETELFFETIIRDDRSVLDFLNADFSYVNERLASHYGIADVKGEEFQRVSLPPDRRGVLTQASILFLTSNPTRTSPVKRGQWILSNILGQPPPPPPPGIEELDEDGETLGSLREQMEQHRSNPSCAVCHRQMDALGFGLENFDVIGAWRDQDGRFDIDPSGELPGNQRFSGPADLMEILAQSRRDDFTRCLAEKMLTYALGRGLGPYDRCAVNAILERMEQNEYRFSSLVMGVVSSDPFLMRESLGEE